MRVLKLIFSLLTILFAILGLAGVLDYDISQPMMFTFLGLLNLVTAKEYSDKGDRKSAKYLLILGLFIIVVIIVALVGRYCL